VLLFVIDSKRLIVSFTSVMTSLLVRNLDELVRVVAPSVLPKRTAKFALQRLEQGDKV